jgi:hypothetical protein
MKGPDGIATRESVFVNTALDDVIVVAAPAAGSQIRVFSMLFAVSATSLITLRDAIPTTYWGLRSQPFRPVSWDSEAGLFSVADSQALILENPLLRVVLLNLTYEVRPTGI